MPSLNGAVVLVTGANGGIGTHFVHQALARGAAKVYATARTPRSWDDERIVPLTLDITDAESVAAAVAEAPDVTALINNAGALPPSASLLDVTEADIRANMETNFFGPVWGVHVTGVHMGYVETRMAAHADGPKMQPADLVSMVYDAVEAGEYEVIADELTAQVKAALSGPVEALYPELRGTGAALVTVEE